MKLKLITIAAVIAAVAACGGRNAAAPQDEPAPEGVVLSPRISNQRVNSFAEDADGHIWIGTFRGLNKYSGDQYHQYFYTGDTLGLPDNQIYALLRSSRGELWIATVNGVAVRDAEGLMRQIDMDLVNRNFSQIFETRSGKILLSNTNSLFEYDPSTEGLRPVIRELGGFGSPAAVLGPDDRLWVSTGGAINVYETGTYSLLGTIRPPHTVYHICLFGDELWASGMGGLSIYDCKTLEPRALPGPIRSEKRLMQGDVDLIYDVDGNSLLLRVIGEGFFSWHRPTGRLLHQSDADFPFDAPDFQVSTVFRDSRHNLWFGSPDQGFSVSWRYKDAFSSDKILAAAFARKSVVSVCPDRDGHLWISTQSDGLYTYDLAARKLERIDLEALIPDKTVGYIRCSRVFCDSEGEIWLVLNEKARVLRCRHEGRGLRVIDTIFSMMPVCICEDERGQIWISSLSPTLQCYDKAARTVADVPLETAGGWTFVSALAPVEAGRLVAVPFGGPINWVNTFARSASAANIPDEDYAVSVPRSVLIPSCVMKDRNEMLWIGTVANGVLLLDPRTGSLSPVEGLPCQDVCSIEEDRQGNIWVSTMNGLARYDRTVGGFVSYFEEDGIGGNQFYDRSSCLLSDGTLVFGGTHGITLFNPLDLPGKVAKRLVFEDLKIHNKLVIPGPGKAIGRELSARPDVTISSRDNGFSISFSALDFSEHSRARYSYMMEGFDNFWVDAGSSHEAWYANLPSGRYVFRVRVTDAGSGAVEAENSLSVRVLPPWWRTWWAWCLYVLVFLGLSAISWLFARRIRKVRRDAARRIRQERQERERAEQAEQAEKALNKIQMNYFSNVAHEFRTPLTMIAGPVSQLAQSAGVTGQDRQLVGLIQRSSTWMLSLVNQLLDFGRIGNKKLQLKVSRTDVVAPLRSLMDLFRFNAEAKGIELVSYGLEEPFTMWADADKITKVIMNLLSNALKFTPSGGRVTLSFDVLPREDAAAAFPLIGADTDLQYACFTVSDSGCGIPEGEEEKIFERFYQADNQGDTHGSGIGLYYARALAGLHHGQIRAANREEGGAVFRLLLPVSEGSYTEDEKAPVATMPELPVAPEPQVAPEEASDRQQRHIAVVDDDIDIANYVRMLLSPSYRVSVHFDAASALKAFGDDVPDLVISDVVMPGMSGYELCEKIKGDLQLSHIPVILVTAKVAVESQVTGLGKGADAYVTKPFQPAYLLALVRSLLENREKLHRRLGQATTTEDFGSEELSPRDRVFMNELYELMDKEIANAELDISRITELMKISRTKFYYKVKGLTGENPAVFFKRYKLNRAADLLREGKHNMSEIAWMTGFNTLSHFSTSFKKQFGVPPSEFVG